jgi:hypothetical protein
VYSICSISIILSNPLYIFSENWHGSPHPPSLKQTEVFAQRLLFNNLHVYNLDCNNIKLISAYSLGLSGIHFLKREEKTILLQNMVSSLKKYILFTKLNMNKLYLKIRPCTSLAFFVIGKYTSIYEDCHFVWHIPKFMLSYHKPLTQWLLPYNWRISVQVSSAMWISNLFQFIIYFILVFNTVTGNNHKYNLIELISSVCPWCIMQHVRHTVSRNSQRDKEAEMFSAGSVQEENTMICT